MAGAPDLALIPDLPVLDPGGLVPGLIPDPPVLDPGGLVPGLIPDPQALRGRD